MSYFSDGYNHLRFPLAEGDSAFAQTKTTRRIFCTLPRKDLALFLCAASHGPTTPLQRSKTALRYQHPPRRLNLSASSDDPTFPKAPASFLPQNAPCSARHIFCSPPPNRFRVRLLGSLDGKERWPRSLRVG